MDDLISRSWLLSEYDKRHKGPPGGARKLIEEAPSALGTDCISRQAAIDYFVTNVGFHDEDGYPIEDECELREIWTGYFDGIPSAQPKMGEWIHRPEIGWGEMWMCNQCGEKTISTVMGKPRYNFCPMCGAKMEVTE